MPRRRASAMSPAAPGRVQERALEMDTEGLGAERRPVHDLGQGPQRQGVRAGLGGGQCRYAGCHPVAGQGREGTGDRRGLGPGEVDAGEAVDLHVDAAGHGETPATGR